MVEQIRTNGCFHGDYHTFTTLQRDIEASKSGVRPRPNKLMLSVINYVVIEVIYREVGHAMVLFAFQVHRLRCSRVPLSSDYWSQLWYLALINTRERRSKCIENIAMYKSVPRHTESQLLQGLLSLIGRNSVLSNQATVCQASLLVRSTTQEQNWSSTKSKLRNSAIYLNIFGLRGVFLKDQ